MAPKPKRNYKAEYARRIAKAATSGKTRQQARGHKPKEHVERARKSKLKYGASPATMTRLRRLAKNKLVEAYKSIAKNPVNETTVKRGMKMLHADDLRAVIEWDATTVVNMKNTLSPLHPGAGSYYDQLAEYFPESVDDIDAEEINPGWYR